MKPRRCDGGFVLLIELLVVVVIILIVVYVVYGQRGVVSPSGVSDEPRTAPGAAIERAKGIQCLENLRGVRQVVSTYRMGGEEVPQSLREMRISAQASACPVSGTPYVYDPETGSVRCTTPGHEGY